MSFRHYLEQEGWGGALELPEGAFQDLERLCAELLRWNRVHNLTGQREPRGVYRELFLDALVLVPHLKGHEVLDIGSGAGFPGLVLALARPDLRVTLLEPRAKRVSFQQHAVRLLGLEGRVRPVLGRAGDGRVLAGERFASVVLKAVGGLSESLALARPLLAPGGRALLPRGEKDQAAARELGLEVIPYHLPGGRKRILLVESFDPQSGSGEALKQT